MNEAVQTMNVEKKAIRSDIPVRHSPLQNGSVAVESSHKFVVPRGITLEGAIAACPHLIVEGSVRADGFTARRIDIPETGAFRGSAEVQDAVISGRFEGRLSVPGRLTIKSTARVSGEITYGTIEVETGAKIEGMMSCLAPAVAAEPSAPSMKSPPAPAAPVAVPGNVEKLFDERAGNPAARPRVFRRAG